MDEGKTAGPQSTWWARPRTFPLTRPWTRAWPRSRPDAATDRLSPTDGPCAACTDRDARRSARITAGAVLLSLLSGGVGGILGAGLERDGGVSRVELPQTPAGKKQPHRASGSIAGIARQALPGVVTLHVKGGDSGDTGTGFVLDKRGHILTNYRVADAAGDAGPLEVTFRDGQTVKGEVVGTDGGYDLAVIKVSGVSGLDPLPLGDSDSAQVGDPVVAIGAPFDLAGTVTYGIVSATHRPVTTGSAPDSGETSYVDALQTDAPINPGNSGGPLVDAEGRVIGINSAIRAADNGAELPPDDEAGSIGLGFAIPVNQGRRVAEELINDGTVAHPVLGVRLDMGYGGDGARVGDLHGGVTKGSVVPGGPGDKAGLEIGDVVTAVDGDRVHSPAELIVKVRSHRPGDVLELTLRRDGDTRAVRLKLGSEDGG